MCETRTHYIGVILSFISFLSSQNIYAEDTDSSSLNSNLCTPQDDIIKHIKPRAFPLESIENTEISADYTQTTRDGETSLDGNIVIEKHLLRVTADHADYSKQQDLLRVSGNVHIDTQTMSLNANAGTVNMADTNRQGDFTDITFLVSRSNMKGRAESIHAGGDKLSVLKNASITSCSFLDPDWLISAEEIRLDHSDEYGSADDVVIRFKDVPFMYTPYMEFPISDKRRSGLLFPEFGTSSSRGIELAVPWYWNIAPNQDAVFTPRYMERRGFELGAKYRYLTKSSDGELMGAYLPEDDLTGEERYQVRYLQHTRILPNLLFDVDLQDISDADYFNDFSNSLTSTSQTHLNRNATLRYDINNWNMKAMVQNIKTIDPSTPLSDRPYERLPQLALNGETGIRNGPLQFTLDTEYVDFTHEDDAKVTGQRFIMRPGFRLPLSGTAWFVDTAVKFSHTQYDTGTNTGTSLDIENRNLPMTSIDAGLYFERSLANGFQQTLEPRLYYLNVPYENQDDIPLFDTSIPDFSVAQLFRDNRFVGGDRVGDANQVTLALTSRFLNPSTGNEFLRASIGQIFYFEDRKVTLLGGPPETENQSDIIAELSTSWNHWQTDIDLQWDVIHHNLSKENYFLHYKSDARHLYNIGYRKRLNDDILDIEQIDTSFVYAINREYSAIVRYNYSLKDRKNIDGIAGISYDSCCWAIQLLAQSRLQNSTTSTGAYENSILVQFVFKGLGSLSGSEARTTLEQSIYGYSDFLQ